MSVRQPHSEIEVALSEKMSLQSIIVRKRIYKTKLVMSLLDLWRQAASLDFFTRFQMHQVCLIQIFLHLSVEITVGLPRVTVKF